MIKYSLICDSEHEFEAWFGSSDDFDKQAKRGFVECPVCGSSKVEKNADGTIGFRNQKIDRPKPKSCRLPQCLPRRKSLLNWSNSFVSSRSMSNRMRKIVGDKFPEEARKIHYGETEARGIYGQASVEEAAELMEEGVGVMPIPQLPEDKN